MHNEENIQGCAMCGTEIDPGDGPMCEVCIPIADALATGKRNPLTGFDCECKTRADCYDGLICHWSFGAAFDKAFRYWDWRVFVIAGWFLDEADGWDGPEDAKTIWQYALEDGGLRAAVIVRIVQLWRLDFRK